MRPGRPAARPVSVGEFVERKGTVSIAACIPARNEAATIEPIVAVCSRLAEAGALDAVVVVDDHSTDATAERAGRAGAIVLHNADRPGKGEALRCASSRTAADILVFLDADVWNFSHRFVTDLALPLLVEPALVLVKASYRRPLAGRVDEGGRVTELLARPLLERFLPELATVSQPLAGECAIRRSALDYLALDAGYGVEIGLLIDVYRRYGRQAITEADLGERVHRNRPLHQLRPHTRAVLDSVMTRLAEPLALTSSPATNGAMPAFS